jgi:hypothetical protein
MKIGRWLFACLTILTLLVGVPLVAIAESKVVIELFTSQGCNSCPPADHLLSELAADERLLALSLPVDYWDYLGWRDTLALHSHSTRQKAYADSRGDRQVYTPQVVINGMAQAIGSDRNAIERSIARAELKNRLAVPVALKRNETSVEVEIGEGVSVPASIWVLGITRAVTVAINRGENGGKTITYHNVVRSWKRIGDWKGAVVRASVPITELADSDADAAVVLVQPGSAGDPGPIRGAAMLSLH